MENEAPTALAEWGKNRFERDKIVNPSKVRYA